MNAIMLRLHESNEQASFMHFWLLMASEHHSTSAYKISFQFSHAFNSIFCVLQLFLISPPTLVFWEESLTTPSRSLRWRDLHDSTCNPTTTTARSTSALRSRNLCFQRRRRFMMRKRKRRKMKKTLETSWRVRSWTPEEMLSVSVLFTLLTHTVLFKESTHRYTYTVHMHAGQTELGFINRTQIECCMSKMRININTFVRDCWYWKIGIIVFYKTEWIWRVRDLGQNFS